MLQNDEYKVQKMPKDLRTYINKLSLDFQKKHGRPMSSDEKEKWLESLIKHVERPNQPRRYP
ncbi:MAG TPA: hypothetical protein VJK04_00335 [Candidatus Paceibacterota bacterium]